MPRLVYCGYYWRVASDEFALPSVFAAVLRAFWCVALAVVFVQVQSRVAGCHSSWAVLLYFTLSLATFVAAIGCEIAMTVESYKGTPSEPEKRKDMPRLLTVHLVLGMMQAFCMVYGFCLLASDVIACSNRVDGPVTTVLLVVVVFSQLVDIVVMMCCSACFQSFSVTQSQLRMAVEHVENVRQWENRCKSCCKWLQLCTCNLFGGTNIPEDLEAVARVLAHVLHHEGMLDLVASDLVAALILVRYLQRKKDQQMKSRLVGSRSAEEAIEDSLHAISSRSLDADLCQSEVKGNQPVVEPLNGTKIAHMLASPEYVKLSSQNHFYRALDHTLLMRSSRHDTALLKVIALHASHMLAIYTWMIQVYMYPCTGCCRLPCLACYCNSDDDRGPTFRRVIGDNIFGTHEGALLSLAGLQQSEIAYANFSNDVDQKPYAVIINHEHRIVVITIRGTMSFEDCITDAFAEPTDLSEHGRKWNFDGEGKFAHGGMVRAAARIRRELEETRLLKILLNGAHVSSDDFTAPLAPANCVGYALHVVGHSLGAGAAIILGLMLQHDYPDLHVFGYGMPGGLMDADTVRATRHLATTIILGNDLVARLTMESITKLRNDMLEALARAKVNKNKIFTSVFKNTTASELMYIDADPPANDFYATVKRYVELLHQRDLEQQQTSLSLPGRIVYLAKTQNIRRLCCLHERVYTPVIASPHEFSDLVVSPTMAVDHFPDRYYLVINEIWNAWADASPYSAAAPAYTSDSKPEDFLA